MFGDLSYLQFRGCEKFRNWTDAEWPLTSATPPDTKTPKPLCGKRERISPPMRRRQLWALRQLTLDEKNDYKIKWAIFQEKKVCKKKFVSVFIIKIFS